MLINKNEDMSVLSKEDTKGILVGTKQVEGKDQKVYIGGDTLKNNNPICVIGGLGSGKSTYAVNMIKDLVGLGESVFFIDTSCNGGFSDEVKRVLGEDKVVEIDFSKEFIPFNLDVGFKEGSSDDVANIIINRNRAVFFVYFIESVLGELSTREKRLISASAKVVGVQKNSTLKDVINCIVNIDERHKYIELAKENISKERFDYIEGSIGLLTSLDYVGTNNYLSEAAKSILDKIDDLKDNYYFNKMYHINYERELNLVEELQSGKCIMVKISSQYYDTETKEILYAYAMYNLNVSLESRRALYKSTDLVPCTFVHEYGFDEKTLEYVESYLCARRILGVRCVFLLHSLLYLSRDVINKLNAIGSNYMFLSGIDKATYDVLKYHPLCDCLAHDLGKLPPYHSLNLIVGEDGYDRFISKLPELL